VVINEKMAHDMFEDGSPIGKRVMFDLDEDKTWFTVIGVVPDIIQDETGEDKPGLFFSVTQKPGRFGGRTTVSIGVATFPVDGATAASVLLAADRAAFVAKRSGRNQIATAEDGLSLAAEFSLQEPTPVDPPTTNGTD